MSALLRVTATLAVFACTCLVLAGCGEIRREQGALRREQVALEERMARLERDFASLSRDRAALAPAPASSGATTSPSRKAAPPAALDPIDAVSGPPRYALHLASYKRTGDVRHGWRELQARFPAVLGGLAPQVEAVDFGDGRGAFYRLKAAGFSDRAQARATCRRLRARHAYCEVQDDAGTPGEQFWNS